MHLLKPTILCLLVFWLSGCVNTKYHGIISFPKLDPDENILVAELPYLVEEPSELFYRTIVKLDGPENQLFYLPEVEYNLLQQGVSKVALDKRNFDMETQDRIHKLLDVKYLMLVDVLKLKSEGSSYGYYTQLDLDRYRSVYNQEDESRTAKLIFTILDLETRTTPIQFITETTINPLIFKGDDGDEHRVNVNTKERAGFVAFKKGLKKLSK